MRAKIVNEISCYMENKPGMLARLAQRLAEENISVTGIQSYDGQLQSLVRVVVDKPDLTEKILREQGVELISRPEIIEVQVRNAPGGLAEITSLLGNHEININSIYSTDGLNENIGRSYIRVEGVDTAVELLNRELKPLS